MATKKEQKALIVEVQEEVKGRGREVWLAGLGALATVEEQGAKLFQDLVKRGEELEGKGRQQVQGVLEDIRDEQQKLEHKLSDTLEGTLDRFGVSTRAEVTDLTKKVDMLTKKVETLTQLLEKRNGGAKPASKTASKTAAPKSSTAKPAAAK